MRCFCADSGGALQQLQNSTRRRVIADSCGSRRSSSSSSLRDYITSRARSTYDTHTDRRKKASPYSTTERTAPEPIPVPGSQPARDASHKPGGRLPLLSARPAVTPANLESCYQFCCLVNRGTIGVNSLPKTVTRQRHGCNLDPGPSAPESSTLSLTSRLPSQPTLRYSNLRRCQFVFTSRAAAVYIPHTHTHTHTRTHTHRPAGDIYCCCTHGRRRSAASEAECGQCHVVNHRGRTSNET